MNNKEKPILLRVNNQKQLKNYLYEKEFFMYFELNLHNLFNYNDPIMVLSKPLLNKNVFKQDENGIYQYFCIQDNLNIEYKFLDFCLEMPNRHYELKVDQGKGLIEQKNLGMLLAPYKDTAESLLELYEYLTRLDYINKFTWAKFIKMFNFEIPKYKISDETSSWIEFGKLNYDDFIDGHKRRINYDNFYDKELIAYYRAIKLDEEKDFYRLYEKITSTRDLLIIFLNYIFEKKSEAFVRKCYLCNKWFIPYKNDTLYCNRIGLFEENSSCKEFNKKQKDKLNKKRKEVQPLVHKIYNNYRSLAENSPLEHNIEAFEKFKHNNFFKKHDYLIGKISKKEYESWLNSHYKTKKKGSD